MGHRANLLYGRPIRIVFARLSPLLELLLVGPQIAVRCQRENRPLESQRECPSRVRRNTLRHRAKGGFPGGEGCNAVPQSMRKASKTDALFALSTLPHAIYAQRRPTQRFCLVCARKAVVTTNSMIDVATLSKAPCAARSALGEMRRRTETHVFISRRARKAGCGFLGAFPCFENH
jgi:hypothetical protein